MAAPPGNDLPWPPFSRVEMSMSNLFAKSFLSFRATWSCSLSFTFSCTSESTSFSFFFIFSILAVAWRTAFSCSFVSEINSFRCLSMVANSADITTIESTASLSLSERLSA